jgi:hypothetical protein
MHAMPIKTAQKMKMMASNMWLSLDHDDEDEPSECSDACAEECCGDSDECAVFHVVLLSWSLTELQGKPLLRSRNLQE